MNADSALVSVIKTVPIYPQHPPFGPDERYPEYPFDFESSPQQNHIYQSVRSLLFHLGLDKNNFGKPCWNPFGEFIHSGDTVLIKPNMVMESHLTRPEDFEYIITHGSVLRAICDYAIIALHGNGTITFADSPETDANFDLICKRNGLNDLINFYKISARNITVQILDLRKELWVKKDGVIIKKKYLPGDPMGYTAVRLDHHSEFHDYQLSGNFYGATFDRDDTKRHHNQFTHEYLLSSTVLNSDVIINVPKLKTHKKAGLTCCLKNLVGINGDKNWLPHYTEGSPASKGDQFDNDCIKSKTEFQLGSYLKKMINRYQMLSYLAFLLKPVGRGIFGSTENIVRSGNWYGNDTLWRMIVDLNKCLFHFDSKGNLRKTKRKVFCVVDAIIAGDNLGPLHADPKPLGILAGAFDPAILDRACARLVGFDYKKIPSILKSFNVRDLPFTAKESENICLVSNLPELNGDLDTIKPDASFCFKPHFGWKGHIESE